MANQIVCDAPDCPAVLPWSGESGVDYPWFVATLTVAGPEGPCGDCGEHQTWAQKGGRVDACSREHLRIALVMKLADLTDEPSPT